MSHTHSRCYLFPLRSSHFSFNHLTDFLFGDVSCNLKYLHTSLTISCQNYLDHNLKGNKKNIVASFYIGCPSSLDTTNFA